MTSTRTKNKFAPLEQTEASIADLQRSVKDASSDAQTKLGRMLLGLHDKDWDRVNELILRGMDLTDSVSDIAKDIEALREFMSRFRSTLDHMRITTQPSQGTRPSLKQSVETFINERVAQGQRTITIAEAMDHLEAIEFRLAVKNPTAVVASMIGRDPRISKKEKGVYEITEMPSSEPTPEDQAMAPS